MTVLVERRDDGVAVVTIDRQEALNALNVETLTELRDRLRELADVPADATGADIAAALVRVGLEEEGEDGSWYREDSKHMERRIREGRLNSG